MSGKDIIAMSAEEIRRLSIVNQAVAKVITQKDAAKVIGLSYRQMKRLVARVRREGNRGIVHKLRGKPGNKAIDGEIRTKAIKLYREKYCDFGPTFASEKLQELDGIQATRETLRLWLISKREEKWDWQRKGRPHRQWRQRKEHTGEMVQMDGSHHDWLEGRGPKLVFIGYVDDATGNVFGRFYDYEGILCLQWRVLCVM